MNNDFKNSDIYLSSTFSLRMLAMGTTIKLKPCSLMDVPKDAISIIRNRYSAAMVAALLGRHVSSRNLSVQLQEGDVLYCVLPYFRLVDGEKLTRVSVKSAGYKCYKGMVF